MEAHNYLSDRKETETQIDQIAKTENRIGYQIPKSVSIFRENQKPSAKKRKIRKPQYHKARRQHLRFQALIFGNSMRFFLSPSTSKSNCIRDTDDEA